MNPRSYEVRYRVKSMITQSTVAEGTATVKAANASEAGEQAVTWVHEHERACDPRLDPQVLIEDVAEVDA